MENEIITPITEDKKEVKVKKETEKIREDIVLESLNPKKMTQKELVYMLGKCRAERDTALQNLDYTKEQTEKAYKIARKTDEEYMTLLDKVNKTYGFIEKASDNFKDSINLAIKGRI